MGMDDYNEGYRHGLGWSKEWWANPKNRDFAELAVEQFLIDLGNELKGDGQPREGDPLMTA